MTSNHPPIAENLRALRDELDGLTWTGMALEMDMPERQLYAWASPTGTRTPSWESVCKLAAYFTEKLGRPIEAGYFYCHHEKAPA